MASLPAVRFRAPILQAGVAALILTPLGVAPVRAGEGGGVVGWVESTEGAPVAGALISIFGKGMRGGGLVTLTDSAGRFILPSVPAGSYRLRALGPGHLPAATREVTVLPDRDSLFTLSLTPVGEKPAAEAAPAETEDAVAVREWHWLVRHKRRSVLEDRDDELVPTDVTVTLVEPRLVGHAVSWLPEFAGKVELMTNPMSLSQGPETLGIDGTPTGLGVLRLEGRLAGGGHWNLGGLVTDSESTTWRMAAEFVLQPGGGHEIQTGAGYGAGYLRPLVPSDDLSPDPRNAGAIFVKDRWRVGERLTTIVGAKYTFIGFLQDRNHVDPVVGMEYLTDRNTQLRASMAVHTLAPGGDLLTLSSAGMAPAISLAKLDPDLRASHSLNFDLALDRTLGATKVGARAFYDDVSDQLVNAYEGTGSSRSLHIYNGGSLGARGMGVTVGRHFGDVLKGSLTYTYGSCRPGPSLLDPFTARPGLPVFSRQMDFHDVVARVETFFDGSGTRVVAFYRINTLNSDPAVRSPLANARFDVQLTQGLPFLQSLTRADWQVLVNVRNLFYDVADEGPLDELTVLHPPTRVLGGISIRF